LLEVPAARWPDDGGNCCFGILCMSMIANLQYGWTLFVTPLDERFHWGRAAIQVAFTLFVWPKPGWCRVEGLSGRSFRPAPGDPGRRRAGRAVLGGRGYADTLVMLYAGP